MNEVNTGAAVAAITSPWWLPAVHIVSDAAGLLLPVLGVVWLIVQITTKIIETRRKSK